MRTTIVTDVNATAHAGPLEGVMWDSQGHLAKLPVSDPPEYNVGLEVALHSAPREHLTPFGDLPRFIAMRRLITDYVKCNNSYAVVHADETVTIHHHTTRDPDFARKALHPDKYVRAFDLEEDASLDPEAFALWISDDALPDGPVDDGQRNWLAEYLINNPARCPIVGAVVIAHPEHGLPLVDDATVDDAPASRKREREP